MVLCATDAKAAGPSFLGLRRERDDLHLAHHEVVLVPLVEEALAHGVLRLLQGDVAAWQRGRAGEGVDAAGNVLQ